MQQALLVGLGGFLGAIARYGTSLWISRHSGPGLPLGTLTVNVVGSLLIGVLMGLAALRRDFSDELRLVLIVGLLGSFTTFSTFSWETIELVRIGELGRAGLNAAANLGLALVATAAGIALVRFVVAGG